MTSRKDGTAHSATPDHALLDVRRHLGFYPSARPISRGSHLGASDSDGDSDAEDPSDDFDDLNTLIARHHILDTLTHEQTGDLDGYAHQAQSNLASVFQPDFNALLPTSPSSPNPGLTDAKQGVASAGDWPSAQSAQTRSNWTQSLHHDPRSRSDSQGTTKSGQDLTSPISPGWIWSSNQTSSDSYLSGAKETGNYLTKLDSPFSTSMLSPPDNIFQGAFPKATIPSSPHLKDEKDRAHSASWVDFGHQSQSSHATSTLLSPSPSSLGSSHLKSPPQSIWDDGCTSPISSAHASHIHAPSLNMVSSTSYLEHKADSSLGVPQYDHAPIQISGDHHYAFHPSRHSAASSLVMNPVDGYGSYVTGKPTNATTTTTGAFPPTSSPKVFMPNHRPSETPQTTNNTSHNGSPFQGEDTLKYKDSLQGRHPTETLYPFATHTEHIGFYSPLDSPYLARQSAHEAASPLSKIHQVASPESLFLATHQSQTRSSSFGHNPPFPRSTATDPSLRAGLNSHQADLSRPRSRSGGLAPHQSVMAYSDELPSQKTHGHRLSPVVKSSLAPSNSPALARLSIHPKPGPSTNFTDHSPSHLTSLLPLQDASNLTAIQSPALDSSEFAYTTTLGHCEVEFKAGRRDCFIYPASQYLAAGDFLIVEADRGYDLGRVVRVLPSGASPKTLLSNSPATKLLHDAVANSPVTTSDAFDDDGGFGGGDSQPSSNTGPKKVLRRAHSQEVQQLCVKALEEQKALQLCQTKVKQRSLPMEVIDAEYQFDRKKLIYYFKAEHRIDFRELVRDLFRIFKTRIWLKQTDGRQTRPSTLADV
eukprot:TRINITY_DN12210_c0_g1_i1.p1 TRINITY_DN12210_c0_g1~~TRINITY_DN12210_c0_g1_i1.p1  ORF type:complete len:816 (+),score=135.28 TRINITY_DN12210_c0_g1_i1:62-2509(+)